MSPLKGGVLPATRLRRQSSLTEVTQQLLSHRCWPTTWRPRGHLKNALQSITADDICNITLSDMTHTPRCKYQIMIQWQFINPGVRVVESLLIWIKESNLSNKRKTLWNTFLISPQSKDIPSPSPVFKNTVSPLAFLETRSSMCSRYRGITETRIFSLFFDHIWTIMHFSTSPVMSCYRAHRVPLSFLQRAKEEASSHLKCHSFISSRGFRNKTTGPECYC